MSDEYILPSELLAMFAFWFGPPLLIAFVLQAWAFTRRGLLRTYWGRFVASLLSTTILSVLLAALGLAFLPAFLSFLGVQGLRFGERNVMVLPLSFVVVAIVAPFVSWAALAGIRHRPNYSSKPTADAAA